MTLREILAFFREVEETGRAGREPQFSSVYNDRRQALLVAVCAEHNIDPWEVDNLSPDVEFTSEDVDEEFAKLESWFRSEQAKRSAALATDW